MQSKIADDLQLQYHPIATLWTDIKPENALQFKENTWGCIISLFTKAAKGRTVVFDRNSFGCFGGGVGLGFGNPYAYFPGGIECLCHLLSKGNGELENGKEPTENKHGVVREDFIENLLNADELRNKLDVMKKVVDQKMAIDIPYQYVKQLPIIDIPYQYVVFKPLQDLDVKDDVPVNIIFLINADQFSALAALVNNGKKGPGNLSIPLAAGCQTLGIFSYLETDSETPRATIGLTDISAQKYIKQQLGKELLSVAVPFKMFKEMEANVEEGVTHGE